MTGMSNYSADNFLNYITGQIPTPTLPSVYLALFTAVGTDANTGFTEVSGGAYARVQVAGAIAAGASWTTSVATITMGTSNPGWVVAGMSVYDTTNSQAIGTVLTYSGTTLTLTANASHASSGSTDSLTFSAFGQGTGTAPSTITNTAAVTFATATANWGTIIAFGLFDASTSGNLLMWDFLGNYNWVPWTCTAVGSGNGAVFTEHAHGYANGTPLVCTSEYGGTFPTATQESITAYAINYAANVTTDTFTLSTSNSAPSSANALWTSTTGDGMIRQVTQQSIPSGITALFAASSLTALAA